MDIVLLFALIFLNGLFAMSEMALVAARKTRLNQLIEEGHDPGAAAALALGEDPTRFMSTVQIGITSIGVMNGIVGEAALAGPLSRWLISAGASAHTAELLSTGFAVVIITYFSIVIGELVPKRLGQSHPEAIARLVSRPITLLALIAKPFVKLLTASTHFTLRVMGIKDQGNNLVTEAEIHAALAEGASAGVIDSAEHAMVRNVFLLDDRQIASLMVPKADVLFLDLSNTFEENIAIIEKNNLARFPVIDGDANDIKGIANARQWLALALRGQSRELREFPMSPALYVPETITGMELLSNFRSSDVHMAFIIDEYGEVQGIVTLQDLVEAITGEFQPRNPATAWGVQRDDGSWLLDGHIPVPELKERLGLDSVPEEELGRYHTLSGMVMLLTGRLPNEADTVHWEGWRLEVLDMDGRTIDKVLASKPSRTPAPADNTDNEPQSAL